MTNVCDEACPSGNNLLVFYVIFYEGAQKASSLKSMYDNEIKESLRSFSDSALTFVQANIFMWDIAEFAESEQTIDNSGAKLFQMRFYPMSTAVLGPAKQAVP